MRDDERSQECGDGQAGHHDDVHAAKPLAAGLRRDELRHGRVSHNVFGPEPHSHDETQQGQHGHRRSKGGSDGRETEDGEIGLIGEAAAVAVAEETGQKRSQHHADKRDGHKLRVLTHGGKTALERGAENGCGDVDVKAIEKHPGADQQHDPAMEGGDEEPIETRARVHGHSEFTSSSRARPGCLSSRHQRQDDSSGRRSFAGR